MNNFSKNLNPEIAKNLNENYKLFEKNFQNYFYELSKRDISEISLNSKSVTFESNKIILNYFNNLVITDIEKKAVFYIKATGNKNEGKNFLIESEVDLFSSSIILHYLLHADRTPLKNEWISYRELPDGLFYSNTIPGILEPLINKYESDGKLFLKKVVQAGGAVNNNFKLSAIIYPFKMFPTLIIFEEKSEEFGADARVLFDRSASHYLKTDIVKTIVVSIVNKLIADE